MHQNGQGTIFAFITGLYLLALSLLFPDFSSFLVALTFNQSLTQADLISSVVLKSFLCPKYYCPNSDPHHLLTSHFNSLLSGLLSTFLPLLDLSSTQTPGLYIQIQPISLLNTLSGATLGQSQNSLAYNPLRPSRTIS